MSQLPQFKTIHIVDDPTTFDLEITRLMQAGYRLHGQARVQVVTNNSQRQRAGSRPASFHYIQMLFLPHQRSESNETGK